jgi:hypothetical protein
VARLMWERDYDAIRQQDEGDRDALADALMYTLDVDLTELYARHKLQITALYRRLGGTTLSFRGDRGAGYPSNI